MNHIRSFSTALVILGALITGPSLHADSSSKISTYFYSSFTYEAQGNYAAALNSVLQVLQADTKNYTATLRAGWLAYMKGSFTGAVKYYKKAVALAPQAVEPKLGMTLPLMAAKKWKETVDALKAVLVVDSKNYTASSRLAYVYFSMGNYTAALKQYNLVLEWYPSDLDMKLGVAWSYLRMGNQVKAHQYFKEVLKVRMYNTNALSGIEVIVNQKMKKQK